MQFKGQSCIKTKKEKGEKGKNKHKKVTESSKDTLSSS